MKIIKIFVCLLTLTVVLPFNKIKGAESRISENFFYLEDGSYYATTITDFSSTTRTTTKSGSKTTKYVNASGGTEWLVSVTGTFHYNGVSSTCVKSTVNAVSYQSTWLISNKTASKSGNRALGSAIANHMYNGTIINTVTKSVTLACNANGLLS